MTPAGPPQFWREAFALSGSVTPKVLPNVLAFGGIAAAVCAAAWGMEKLWDVGLGMEVAPFEFAGVALGLILVLRTNAGYDRWWEGRRLWGGIVNQCRNIAAGALAYGPPDAAWRGRVVRWTAAFPHAARSSLRGEPPAGLERLLGPAAAARVAAADHMPGYVALELADLLREGRDRGMDGWAFAHVNGERASLIDHVGGCERILKAPLPKVSSINTRRLITLFLLSLPFALLHRMDAEWLVPVVTMLVAYPMLCLDRIGAELQNPFSTANLSHLPLDDISATIERNLLALLADGHPAEKSV